ncbi:expressed unknown protein [Seminavis robusta]|uniref:Uncharacterized protein n=1 Tax=Seminavis robusta TaxID=568900 RepID=A0A9N8HI32_9STRA|nr:expressed unknown protein [Seminavis robusta]|eukprot:Sro599_g173290.1 n/a (551) ;mRNA; r:38749-40506
MDVPDIDVLEMAGIYRKRIENLFSNNDGKGPNSNAPSLQQFLEGWLADVKGDTSQQVAVKTEESNQAAGSANDNGMDDSTSQRNGRRSSVASEVSNNMDSNSRRGSLMSTTTTTGGARSSIKWEPPLQSDNSYPPSPPTSPIVPPPPPTQDEFHSESLPGAVAHILVEQDDSLNKDDIVDELSYMTTRDYDMDSTLESVQQFVQAKNFTMTKMETCDRWKILRQPQGYYLLILRLYLKDRSIQTHYYKHHAMAYHKRTLTDRTTLPIAPKDISSMERAERVFDSHFSSLVGTAAKYRHSALLHAYEITRKPTTNGNKRKQPHDSNTAADTTTTKRSRPDVDEERRWVPITGEYTSIPDAIVLLLKNMDVKANDIPKNLNHDYWLESVKKYVRMPVTRYLNTKLLKPVSLQQQSVNNHLNILRERSGNHLVVMTVHFEEDRHGPVPKLTHGMVWLAEDRLLFDHNTVDKPAVVTDRDLRSIGTAKKVFDSILRPLMGRRSRLYKFCSVRSAYRIKHMTAADIEEMEEAKALREAAAVAASNAASSSALDES